MAKYYEQIVISVDTTDAVKSVKYLTNEIEKLKLSLKPKWWQFWKWFRPIIIHLDLSNGIIIEKV